MISWTCRQASWIACSFSLKPFLSSYNKNENIYISYILILPFWKPTCLRKQQLLIFCILNLLWIDGPTRDSWDTETLVTFPTGLHCNHLLNAQAHQISFWYADECSSQSLSSVKSSHSVTKLNILVNLNFWQLIMEKVKFKQKKTNFSDIS